ncbi:hypothetical protein ZOSMA_155G00430 [Zostera marina]|uniref:Uncharacterized protein n=1 Tax=Zostera marina TaxID=29655 RepID=A0A0K9PXU1_ZOSMR|nr:hypothetical protein ZOSMA_155G00430 [Zostera marina]
MATLAPGILLKLLDGMNSEGINNPLGVHRNALLQITDIVPVDLDEKSLLPKRGFYIKVSDSSHSVYVSLPFDEDDLVMSNKMKLGQFIHVERLEPGSPVPIMKGTKPIPGRHPLVGTPVQIKNKAERSSDPTTKTRSVSASKVHPRGSWERNDDGIVVIQPTVLNLESGTCTPMKRGRRMPLDGERRKSGMIMNNKLRSSVNRSLVLTKSTNSNKDDDGISSLVRKSFSSSHFFRSKSVTTTSNGRREVPKSLLSNSLTPAERTKSPSPMRIIKKKPQQLPLPGKLRLIEKEVLQQKKITQRIALQALRDASAAESVAKLLIMFSDLSSTAKPEAPVNCFEKFLAFYQETTQALVHMQTPLPDKKITKEEDEEEEEDTSVLREIAHNKVTKRNLVKTPKPARLLTTTTTTTVDRRTIRTSSSSGSLFNSIELTKQLQTESGIWFMDFLDVALEKVINTTSTNKPQRQLQKSAVLLKIINWIEVEQNDGSKRSVHPKAVRLTRKLRIKIKNP